MKIADLEFKLNNGLAVYQHYLGGVLRGAIVADKQYDSPLGYKRRRSFTIFTNKLTRHIMFEDHAMGVKGNCWDFAMLWTGKDFREVVKEVRRDILHLPEEPDEEERLADRARPTMVRPLVQQQAALGPRFKLTPTVRAWRPQDCDYFPPEVISRKTLDRFHCAPLSSYEYDSTMNLNKPEEDRKKFSVPDSVADPMYAYGFPATRHIKIVRPRNRRFKWIADLDKSRDVFGLDLVPQQVENLVLSAGNRDCMALDQLMLGYDFYPIAMPSEDPVIDEDLIRVFRSIAKNIWILGDHDDVHHPSPGQLKQLKAVKQYGFKPLDAILYPFMAKDMFALLHDNPASQGEVRDYFISQTNCSPVLCV